MVLKCNTIVTSHAEYRHCAGDVRGWQPDKFARQEKQSIRMDRTLPAAKHVLRLMKLQQSIKASCYLIVTANLHMLCKNIITTAVLSSMLLQLLSGTYAGVVAHAVDEGIARKVCCNAVLQCRVPGLCQHLTTPLACSGTNQLQLVLNIHLHTWPTQQCDKENKYWVCYRSGHVWLSMPRFQYRIYAQDNINTSQPTTSLQRSSTVSLPAVRPWNQGLATLLLLLLATVSYDNAFTSQ